MTQLNLDVSASTPADEISPQAFDAPADIHVESASPCSSALAVSTPTLHSAAIDGLRFLAVVMVFLRHAGTGSFFGDYGVRIFFVISGFLIGRILLIERQSTATLGEKLYTFYARRTLRIFPLYYGVLLLIWLLQSVGIYWFGQSSALVWQATYLSNFYEIFYKVPGSTGHFWSLAIEEQFYIIAPILILTLPRSAIIHGILGLWILNIGWYVSNVTFLHLRMHNHYSHAQFGFIAMGIAAAFINVHGSFYSLTASMLYKLSLVSGVLSLVIGALYKTRFSVPGSFEIIEWFISIASAGFLLALWNNEIPHVQRLFAFSPFVYLGRISYGLYVYHSLFLWTAVHYWGGSRSAKYLSFALTVAVASMSWHFFEKPINDLKRFFPYSRPPKARQIEAAS